MLRLALLVLVLEVLIMLQIFLHLLSIFGEFTILQPKFPHLKMEMRAKKHVKYNNICKGLRQFEDMFTSSIY